MAYENSKIIGSGINAHVAQQVEHLHGKQEVTGSSPVVGSINVFLNST